MKTSKLKWPSQSLSLESLTYALLFLILLLVPWTRLEIQERITIVEPAFILLGMAVLIQFIRSNWRIPYENFPSKYIIASISVWIVAVWLSGINAPHFTDYLFHSTAMTYLACLTLAVAVLTSQSDSIFENSIKWLKYAIVIVAILGIIGVAYLLITGVNDRFFYSSGKKLIVPFTRPNQLAGYLVLFLPLIWEQFRKPQRLASQIGYGLVFAAMVISLLVTSSRTGLIVVLFAGAIYLGWYILRSNFKLIAAMVLSSGVLAVIIIFLGNFLPRVKRALSAVDLVIREGQYTDVWRLENWSNALNIFTSNPIFGYGIGNIWLDHGYEVHNSYLSTLVETGIVGAVSLGILLTYTLFLAGRNVWISEKLGYLSYVAMSRGLFVGLLSFYLYATQHQVLRHRHLWIVIGLVIAIDTILRNRKHDIPS